MAAARSAPASAAGAGASTTTSPTSSRANDREPDCRVAWPTPAREEGLRHVAAARVKGAAAHGVELQRTGRGVGAQDDRRLLPRLRERRIRGSEQRAEQGEVEDRGKREAREQRRLAAEPVAQPAAGEHEGRADHDGGARKYRHREAVNARDALEEIERV